MISGRAHRKAAPSTARVATTTSASLRRRLISLSVLRGPGPLARASHGYHTNAARESPVHLSRAGAGGYNGFARVDSAGRGGLSHGTATARATAPRRVS